MNSLTRFKFNSRGQINEDSKCTGAGEWETENGLSLSKQIVTDYYSVWIGEFVSQEVNGVDILLYNKKGTGSTGFDWKVGRWYHSDINRVRVIFLNLGRCLDLPRYPDNKAACDTFSPNNNTKNSSKYASQNYISAF